MPSKRILFFCQSFSPHTETFVYNDIIHTSAKHEVLVVCLQRMNQDRFPYDQVKVVPYRRPWLLQKIWNRLYAWNLSMNYYCKPFATNLNKIIARFQPDVIHCHFGITALLLTDNLSIKSIPVIVNFLGYDASLLLKKSKIYRQKIKRLVTQPNVFTTANANSLLNYLKLAGAKPVHFRRIYLGIDTDFFKRQASPPSLPFTFLQVAGFREKKGHIYTLQAFSQFLPLVNPQNYRLMLIGDGVLKDELQAYCKQAGIAEQVQFVGWESSREVKKYLERANCFIHPSITPPNGDKEGIPVAITEAMAMELPIISTFHSGIPELIEDEVHGLLVEEKNIDQYVQAMQKVTQWKLLPQNRVRICQQFSIEKRMEALEQYYRYAIQQLAKP